MKNTLTYEQIPKLINNIEIQKLGYSVKEASTLSNLLCNTLPCKKIMMTIRFNRRGKHTESLKDVRHVSLEDAIDLCNRRIKNKFNIRSVNVEMWTEFRGRLEGIV